VVLDWGFWQSDERQEASAFFRDSGYEIEWHYVDADEQTLSGNLKKRNNTDNSNNEFYFIDDETAEYFWSLFEPPKRNEIDIWHHKLSLQSFP
jgi:predicted kinase